MAVSSLTVSHRFFCIYLFVLFFVRRSRGVCECEPRCAHFLGRTSMLQHTKECAPFPSNSSRLSCDTNVSICFSALILLRAFYVYLQTRMNDLVRANRRHYNGIEQLKREKRKNSLPITSLHCTNGFFVASLCFFLFFAARRRDLIYFVRSSFFFLLCPRCKRICPN